MHRNRRGCFYNFFKGEIFVAKAIVLTEFLLESNLRDWQTLGTYQTKTEAQNAESRLAKSYGCVSHPGGDGSEYDTWYVYKFSY